MSKKRFGIDIDGTITRPDTILPYINKDFKTELKLEDIKEYNIRKFVGVDEQTMYQWFRSNEENIYKNSPLKDDSKQILNTWAEHFAELFYISARNASLMTITEEWFIHHQLTYNHLELIGSHDKIESIKKHKIELFFEDKDDNAVQILEECNIPVVLFNTPYNQGVTPNGIIRVNNWTEADEWVRRWLNRKNGTGPFSS
ncbi:hypothetical protein IEO70_04425 [Bacillus sp. AGMB 02131]|uniref:Nucleotidase n=1 Tax=Peribacillus faecalis TaxID=2772559 RepID=A0A927HA62_9BACI|nr:hypothetical protein [Peribacillus faecalis]MBD3107604.1 hypothetical protein [Peribacillus faecalis]